ncbi:MAG: protein translocase subunit SecDF [Prevotellaceae bacterium]|nr:protein translocase subunit SecDF [Prevotellaceae bacterium]
MQNKGIVKFIAIALALVCIFYLSFSFVTSHYENKAAAMGEREGQEYLDSIANEKVWLGYTFKQCRETEIGLGLDLKGGMNVILEVSVPDVVDILADHKKDQDYVKALSMAKEEAKTSQTDFITLFVNAYKEVKPNGRLAEIFATQQLKGEVNTQSTDKEVIAALNKEVGAAIENSYRVVRSRIDKFGVVQPNIQKLEGQQGRIMVEMPGIKEPERMRKLLQGSANLEFWETFNGSEIIPYFNQLDQLAANNGEVAEDTTAVAEKVEAAEETAEAEVKDTAATADAKKDLAAALSKTGDKDAAKDKAKNGSDIEKAKKQHPLLAIFQPAQGSRGACVGYASYRDTADVNKVIYSEYAKRVLPTDLKLLWGAKAADFDARHEIFELYAIKVTQTNGRAPIEGDVITTARDEFDNFGKPSVSMSMNSDGARRWAQLTKANVGKAVAIVLDNVVYSAPNVNCEIDGGNSQITGSFTVEDTKDLANTLVSGKMPAPARIVQEEVVGPSLGQASINQGIWSFIIAFVLLCIFMMMLYGVIPGLVADCALLLNLFFTLGILTSFQAALTMPGIAGIVLTLGMAVDANVLIYERTKEELRAGHTTREAIALGYSNAFSAIFDSNLTSILTGIILYMFGTGPIRGFATTLIIGIVCSFFTAVFLTRLVYENRLKHDKWQNLTFVTAMSKNFMQNTKFDFMSMYKKTFTLVGIAAIVFLAFLFTRGLSKSIDFTGGRNYVVVFEKAVEPEQVREVLASTFEGYNSSAIALGTDHKTIRISTNYKIEENDPAIDGQVEEKLFKSLSDAGLCTQKDFETFKDPDVRNGGSIISSTKVGPSVAKDITHGAYISCIIALIVIFLYILLRFRNMAFSIGSTVALAFDALTVLGLYSICWGWMPFSLEIDQTFIGAILTVIGYSINDKVVVFDRMRENIKLYPNREHYKLFNESLNQTLARTINTSTTTLLVLFCIFVLGGQSIRSFAFAMILGVIFGTLSSIFIASPIAYLFIKKSKKK